MVSYNIAGSYNINGNSLTDFGGNGGGIYNSGTGSKIELNDAGIFGNVAISGGTGPYYGGYGGGLFNLDGYAKVQQSSFYGNEAQFDGGGIWNKGSLTVSNTSFDQNVAGVDFFFTGDSTNPDYGGNGGGIFNYPGYYTFLQPFPNYFYTNYANAGTVGAGLGPDIYPTPGDTARITVNTGLDIVDGDTSSFANLIANPGADGRISLREAVLAANNQSVDVYNNMPGGNSTYTDYIAIDVGQVAYSLYKASGGDGSNVGYYNALTLTQNSALIVQNDPNATLDAVFYITDTGARTVGPYNVGPYDTAVVGGYGNAGVFKLSKNAGAAFYDLTLTDGDRPATNGGGLHLAYGSYAVLDNTNVVNNQGVDGGGIYVGQYAQLYVTNNADGYGIDGIFTDLLGRVNPYTATPPRIFTMAASVSAPPATATSPTTPARTTVAASSVLAGVSLFDYTVVEHNAAVDGGGIYSGSGAGSASIVYLKDYITGSGADDVKIGHNTATDDGGGIFLYGGKLVANDSYIYNNGAYGATGSAAGGGLYMRDNGSYQATATITDSVISHNLAYDQETGLTNAVAQGGGIMNYGSDYSGGLQLDTVTLSSNIAKATNNTGLALAQGGGLYNSGTVSIQDSTVGDAMDYLAGNQALAYGSTKTLTGIEAQALGGGIFNQDTGTLTVDPSTVGYNVAYSVGSTATAYGGGTANYGYAISHDVYYVGNQAHAYGKQDFTFVLNTPANALAYAGGGGFFNATGAYAYIDSSNAANYGFTSNVAYAQVFAAGNSVLYGKAADGRGYAYGGGIYNQAGAVLGSGGKPLSGLDFKYNQAQTYVVATATGSKNVYALGVSHGGGFDTEDQIGALTDSAVYEFYKNAATSYTKALLTSYGQANSVSRAIAEGGGFYYGYDHDLSLTDIDFKGNTATGHGYALAKGFTPQAFSYGYGYGGGLFQKVLDKTGIGDLTLTGNVFDNNVAHGESEAILVRHPEQLLHRRGRRPRRRRLSRRRLRAHSRQCVFRIQRSHGRRVEQRHLVLHQRHRLRLCLRHWRRRARRRLRANQDLRIRRHQFL